MEKEKQWERKWNMVVPEAYFYNEQERLPAELMSDIIEGIWPLLREAVKPKIGDMVVDFGMNVYSAAISCARTNNQIVGEKNDFYITLWQLEEFLKRSE